MVAHNASKILLVEDEVIIALEEAQMLGKYGYEVLTVRRGEEAVEAAEADPEIALVLMDIDLGPGMDGTEAARQILSRRELPVVFLTAHTEQEYIEKVEEITSYGIVQKSAGEFFIIQAVKMAFRLFAAHQETKKSERKYRLIADNSTEMVTTVDLQFKPTYVSPSVEQLLGYSQEEYMEKDSWQLLTEESYEEAVRLYRGRQPDDQRPIRLEVEMIRKDGSTVTCESFTKPLLDEQGKRIGTIVSTREITRRKEIEERLRALVENAPVAFFYLDRYFRITYENPRARELLGVPAGEESREKGRDIRELPSVRSIVSPEEFDRVAGEGKRVELESSFESMYGKRSFIRATLVPMRYRQEFHGAVLMVEDITEKEETERINEERKLYVEAILKSNPNAILTLDTENRIKEWNPGAEALFRYTKEEVMGRDLDELLGGDDDSTYREALSLTRRVSSGYPVPPTETVRYTKDGEPLNVIVAGSPIMVEGTFSGIVATYTDVTRLKEKEQQVKSLLEEKEQLLQEVHHRIKNHMNTLSSIVSLHKSSAGDSAAEVLGEVEKKIGIMQNIYQTLYTGRSVDEVRLPPFMESLVEDIESSYIDGSNVRIESEVEELVVTAKQSLPVGIVVNELVTNSLKYAFADGAGGTVGITLTRAEGGYLRIEVADDGAGVSEEVAGGGAYGFGLTLVEAYAQQYRGELSIERDGGTRVTVTLLLE